MQDLLAVLRETARAVRHQTLALRRANRDAEIRPTGLAELALLAFRRVERESRGRPLDALHALADLFDDAAAFVSQDRGNAPSGSAPDNV
jgi:hypothetical protein